MPRVGTLMLTATCTLAAAVVLSAALCGDRIDAAESKSPPVAAKPTSAPTVKPLPAVSKPQPADNNRRALLLCGLPGDDEHETAFTAVLDGLRDGLAARLSLRPEQIHEWSSRKLAKDHPGQAWHRGPATAEAVRAAAAELRAWAGPQRRFWVIVVGHAHFDGRRAWWNLPGPDIDYEQFGALFRGLPGAEQVFIITTPVSGYAAKPLSQKGRVIVTATEADREVNATLHPILLAMALSTPPPRSQFDVDKDGRITVLDLYLTVAEQVLKAYADSSNIPTEHAQLDDNGDGRASEVQLDFLPAGLGGRRGAGPPAKIAPGADGALAATIELSLPAEDKPQAPPSPSPPPSTSPPSPAKPAPSSAPPSASKG